MQLDEWKPSLGNPPKIEEWTPAKKVATPVVEEIKLPSEEQQVKLPERKPFDINEYDPEVVRNVRESFRVGNGESDKPVDKPHEPDTLWGGRMKGLADYGKDLMLGQLKSMAQPQTTGDFLSLILPDTLGAAPKVFKGKNEPLPVNLAEESKPKPHYTSADFIAAQKARAGATDIQLPPEFAPMEGQVRDIPTPSDSFKPSFDPAKFGKDKPSKFNLHMNLPSEARNAELLDKLGGKEGISKAQTSIPEWTPAQGTTTPKASLDAAIEKVVDGFKQGEEVPPLRSKNVLNSQSQTKGSIKTTEWTPPEKVADTKYGAQIKAETINMKPGRTGTMTTDELSHLNTAEEALEPERLNSIREDIRANGIKQPLEITVSRNPTGDIAGQYVLDEGHHRLAIAKELGIKEVPVKVVGNRASLLKDETGSVNFGPVAEIIQQEGAQAKSFPGKVAKAIKDDGFFSTVGNTSKGIKSSFDLSALRQAAFMVNKKEFWTSLKPMIKMFGDEGYFAERMAAIRNSPTYKFKVENGLQFTDDVTREEAFLNPLAEEVPIMGRVVKASNRAYSGFLNEVRNQVSDSLLQSATNLGRAPGRNPGLAREIMDFVNNATGRGSLGGWEKAAKQVNAVLFSPRLMASRVHMLNPVNYIKADPFIRKEMLKSIGALFGGVTAMAFLADQIPGVDVSYNPKNSDFMKIKTGKTRLDLGAGNLQLLVLASRILTASKTSSVSGETTSLGKGYKPDTAKTLIEGFFENKAAPLAKFGSQVLEAWTGGKDFNGQPISVPKEAADMFIPMIISDMKDIIKEDPQALPFVFPAIFGGSLQTYKDPAPKRLTISGPQKLKIGALR